MAKRRGAGDGSIFRDGKHWVACIDVAGADGHRHRRKRSARTYAEARVKLRELQAEATAGVAGTGKLTLGEYLGDWLAHVLPARGVSIATTENYATMIRIHITPALGAIRLDQLRAEHVDGLLRNMADAGKAHSTMRLVRTVLVMALTHAERRDMVMRNAARLSIVPPGPVRQSRSLTREEAKTLFASIEGEPLEAAWLAMILLGLRPGEAFALEWQDVDLERRVLRVRQAIKRAGGAQFALGEPKTPKSRRSLGMPARVVEAFRQRVVDQQTQRNEAGEAWSETGLVFTTAFGTMIDPANSRRAFRRCTEAAGLGRWHPHEGRHSAASILSDAGVPLEVVADVLGHAPGSKVTGEVYRHAITPLVGAAQTTMDDIFGQDSADGSR
ncbi:MAG: site-specific integrase [Acidimicrobiales bacterium]